MSEPDIINGDVLDNVSLDKPVAEVVGLLLRHEDGDVIPYAKIEAIVGRSHDTSRCKRVIGKARVILRKQHQVMVENIPRQGYRRLHGAEQTLLSNRIAIRAHETAVIASEVAMVSPDRLHTEHDRMMNERTQIVCGKMLQAISPVVNELMLPSQRRRFPELAG